jgi:glycosyltransferase involved in cell wall biosynthesis
MRITLDARMMGAEQTRGIGRYIQELVRAMVTAAPKHQYTLLIRHPHTSPFQGNASVRHVKANIPWYSMQEQLRMPFLIAKTKPNMVHIPHWNVPVLSSMPRVVTIHDLLLLQEPSSTKSSTKGVATRTVKYLGYRAILSSALHGSRRILVPTQWVADDLVRRLPSLATPVDITGEGMPAIDVPWVDPNPSDAYLLYVGSAYPHKNLDKLLDAWADIAMHYPALSLVIAGEKDVFMAKLEAYATQRNLPRIRWMGRVSEEALTQLYQRATAFVFPSRQEGFGLPPLEALAHGCPVIAAHATCLPEVLGEAGAYFFQPNDTDDILRAVERVLDNPVGGLRRSIRLRRTKKLSYLNFSCHVLLLKCHRRLPPWRLNWRRSWNKKGSVLAHPMACARCPHPRMWTPARPHHAASGGMRIAQPFPRAWKTARVTAWQIGIAW